MLMRLLTGLICTCMLTAPGLAGEFGTSSDAVALVKRVQSKLANDGPAATFAAITQRAPEFVDKDLYVFVYDLNGRLVAHGGDAMLVGESRYALKDANGKSIVSEIINVARRYGHGWVDYAWSNPVSVDDMSSYVEMLDDKYIVGVPIFRADGLKPRHAQNEN